VIGCRNLLFTTLTIIHEREVPRNSRSTVYYSTPCADTACTRYAGATVYNGGSKCPSGTVRPLLPRNRRKGAHVGVEKVRTAFNTHVRFAGRVGACASPVVMDLQAKYAAFARGNGAVDLYLGYLRSFDVHKEAITCATVVEWVPVSAVSPSDLPGPAQGS
jgi:hypothetical protein